MSLTLKLCLLATGCAGIVAEFVLSTLATYLLGNAVFQWTVVTSLMLFAMGLGSRLSKNIERRLLDRFILIEFGLALLCASSSVVAYGTAAYTSQVNLILYGTAMAIGILIGMEIPLITRLNQRYEDLRLNISSVMEKDYLGALAGGLFFAFFALPHLGLTYTPIVLGGLNFLVASVLLWRFSSMVHQRSRLTAAFVGCGLFLATLAVLAQPIIRYGEQAKYRDKVIYAHHTPYQKIVITQWKDDYWLYLDGQEQFSTYDEERYHEPLVHPALGLTPDKSRVLILGGGDGLAAREVLKHPEVRTITLVDIDREMTRLAQEYPVLTRINGGSLNDPRVHIYSEDALTFLKNTPEKYGTIIVDMPDPDTLDLMHVYSLGFYRLVRKHLIRNGTFVTQATSPYFANQAFLCILKTVRAAGFSAVPYHNSVPTMGEWGWVLGVRKEDMSEETLKQRLLHLDFENINTRFLNRDAMISMLYFGKGIVDPDRSAALHINRESNPVLFEYYQRGSWGIY